MTKTAIIQKQVRETMTMRTGAPLKREVLWLVIDRATGKGFEVARTQKLARERARFAGYTVVK